MSRIAINHRLTPLTFLLCIRHKLRIPIYPDRTQCICCHHDHDIYGDQAFCCEKGNNKQAHNVFAKNFAGALSPVLAQAASLTLAPPWL